MAGEQTAYQIVRVTEESTAAFRATDLAAFFFDDPRPPAEDLASLDLTRTFAATRTGAPPFAGNYSSYDMAVTVPAPDGLRSVPMAGLTWVAVHPDERRRGALTQMMRHHFADLREQGVALSGLHAAEPAIYGRFGYGICNVEATLGLSRGDELVAPGLDDAAAEVRTRVEGFAADGVAKRVHGLHVELTAAHLGAVTRTERQTIAESRDHLPSRRGSEPTQVLFAERGGVDVGYALFRRSSQWEGGRPQGSLACHELIAADSAALLALARRILDFDLISTVTFEKRSLGDPLLWWARGPRGASVRVYDGAWLRLVDVGSALAQRGFAAPLDAVLEVTDPFCPWNEGRWRLRCDGPGAVATCERTDREAELRLPVQALASAYCGLRSIVSQQLEGSVVEVSPGAVDELSTAMATATQPVAAAGF